MFKIEITYPKDLQTKPCPNDLEPPSLELNDRATIGTNAVYEGSKSLTFGDNIDTYSVTDPDQLLIFIKKLTKAYMSITKENIPDSPQRPAGYSPIGRSYEITVQYIGKVGTVSE